MAPLTLVVLCALSLCVKQSFAEDPEFPKFTGNYTGTGSFEIQGIWFHAKCWYNDALRSLRQELKTYGKRLIQIVLGTNGKYGTKVTIHREFGKERCTYVKGTAEDPIKYTSLFDSINTPKYVGIETENGVELQKWQYDGDNFIYVRQGKNGVVPVRIVNDDGNTMNYEISTNVPASVFQYDSKSCKKAPQA